MFERKLFSIENLARPGPDGGGPSRLGARDFSRAGLAIHARVWPLASGLARYFNTRTLSMVTRPSRTISSR